MNFGCEAKVFQLPHHRQYLFVVRKSGNIFERTRILIVVSILALIFSCNTNDAPLRKPTTPKATKKADSKFELSIISDSIPVKGFVKFNVPFHLRNSSSDTLYLASTSCYGPGYFIKADTTRMKFFSLISCIASWTTVEKILPLDTLTFTSCIQNLNAIDTIQIGFRFMNEKQVNIEKLSYQDIKERSKVYWTTIKL